jgi:chorismate mutase / prephenate dehydratase
MASPSHCKKPRPLASSKAPVYYLGPEGTFSHIVARRVFRGQPPLVPRRTLEAVVEDMLACPGARAVLPVENSSGGTVYDSIDTLIRHAGNLRVTGEVALAVRIALLAKSEGPLRTIYSHFTQIKHHADWLRSRYPHAACRAVSSTALAAKRAAASTANAALASPGAAEIYGLKIIDRPPRDRIENVTHFFLLENPATRPPAKPPKNASTKTALVVALPNACGSLHAFLGPFAKLKVNLSRIVSRPVRGKPQTYVFFVEIEGDPTNPAVQRALARAMHLSESMVNLGSFPLGRHLISS